MERLPFEKPRVYRDAKAVAAFRQRHRRCAVKGCRYVAEVHHVRSKSLGGSDEESNLAPLCPAHHTGGSGPHSMGHRRWFQNFEAQLDEETAEKFRRVLQVDEV